MNCSLLGATWASRLNHLEKDVPAKVAGVSFHRHSLLEALLKLGPVQWPLIAPGFLKGFKEDFENRIFKRS